jgi:cyclic pyranopterin phosphate synthase
VKDLTLLNHCDILSYEEILKVLQAAAEIGIQKVRLTGGEPLVRRNFVHFVESVCRMSAFKEVSITTNGVHLKEKAQEIFDAGVRRINVSLDTLDPVKYAKITGRDYFDHVWEGLEEAEAVGFSPIKVNVVAIRGINDDELLDFAQLSVRKPYHIRFIEYMPIGHNSRWTPKIYISSDEIKYKLDSYSPLHKIRHLTDDGPAKRCRFESAKGEIGFISALSHHFCSTCNRLRLTADGKLRPCLFAEDEVDIKAPLRSRCSQEDLRRVFQEAIAKKPKGHLANISERVHCLRTMSAIGG